MGKHATITEQYSLNVAIQELGKTHYYYWAIFFECGDPGFWKNTLLLLCNILSVGDPGFGKNKLLLY